ncbi:LytTR family DNA-binding domain-containing protein [Polaribacter sp. Z022]|uniref:LytR/AlgR family response regulator transcription factor n=1 Tax=Polaribacter sp. Z022 TaxID=2927125 RepID=UPI002020C6AE|nr:LytTR family DNA-binding domain-containing protein [Polaribacter sp. Z022]MCL7753310.1 LytTR family DNA-binding domain-containing protein [Polaribacter sp. Z022]
MITYKTLIIDDDTENINILSIYLKKYLPMINIVAVANNVNQGITEYLKTQPDILLLDIDLGNDTIFSFIDNIGSITGEIIFISSHPEFGVKAVNYNVTGFIVKPINVLELQKTINKAITNIQNKRSISNNSTPQSNAIINYPTNIAIPTVNKIELIPVSTIMYLEANGKYTIFHLTNNKEKIASRNLGEFEKILDPIIFFRVHHRYLVNIKMVSNIYKTDGNYCELNNGKNIPIAKRRQELLNKFLRLK